MTVSKKTVLGILPPFKGSYKVVERNQDVNDIIRGVIDTHKVYTQDYDRIYMLFDSSTVVGIASNVFDFLKKNVDYNIESEDLQTLRSPAAVIAADGADCKSYALFIAGIIDAFNRNEGAGIPYSFRFASYDPVSRDAEHVFVVLYPGTSREIWVDPVLTFLDERKNPYFYTDKKMKGMSLQTLSGVPVYGRAGQVGDIFTDILNAGGTAFGLPGLGSIFSGLFGGSGPNANDWEGWPDADAIHWTLYDGDSVSNEASNIISYVKNKKNGSLLFMVGQVTPAQLKGKMDRGGYSSVSAQLADLLQKTINAANGGAPVTGQAPVTSGATDPNAPRVPDPVTKHNTINYIVGGGILLFLLTRKK